MALAVRLSVMCRRVSSPVPAASPHDDQVEQLAVLVEVADARFVSRWKFESDAAIPVGLVPDVVE